MRILFPTIAYKMNSGSIYNDLVDCLVEHGHQIVICRSCSDEKSSKIYKVNSNLTILNIKTGNQFERNLIKKGINMMLLEKQFINDIKKELENDKFDLILYATPPISLNGVVKFCKKKYNARTFLMLKDIFPQNAVDLNIIKKNSIVYKIFSKKEENLYQISDYIGCMSQKNIEYLNKYNQSIQDKAHIFFNSIKIPKEITFKSSNNNTTTFLFGGNLGKPQNMPFLIDIIENLKNYPLANFIIVGTGTEEYLIKQYSEENTINFRYLSYLKKVEYDRLLQSCDVGLICLDPRFTIANIPSKLPTYYALKKPVLAITDDFTDLRNMVETEKCGWWCSSNNKDEVINVIKKICKSKEEQIKRGLHARNYALKYFDVEINVKQIENFMEVINNETV